MKEELKQQELARRLEQATAADSPSELEPEISALRSGWLAWGNLLERGTKVEPEKLERLLEISQGPRVAEVRKEPARQQRKWLEHSSFLTTLAVLLLLAVGMWKFAPIIEPPPPESAEAKYGVSLAWNDGATDWQMMRIGDRLTVAQYGSVSLGRSFDNACSRLENITREIEQNSM